MFRSPSFQFQKTLTQIETSQSVGALPELLAFDADLLADEWHPAAEHIHFVADECGAVQGARQRRRTLHNGLNPDERAGVQDPQISQATAAHASVDDEVVLVAALRLVGDGCVGLAGRRRLAEGGGDLPLVWRLADRQSVQVVQVARNVALGIVAVIGQTSKQIDLVIHERKGVTQASTGRISVVGRLWLDLLPLPFGSLEKIWRVIKNKCKIGSSGENSENSRSLGFLKPEVPKKYAQRLTCSS